MITEFSAKTGISVEDILGRRRTARIAEAREMYYYVLLLNGFPVTEIARLTERSHCAVISGIKRIKSLLDSNDMAAARLLYPVKDIKR